MSVKSDQSKLQRKAAILVEALPYMKKYNGETFVIKYGGNAMIDESLSQQFAEDITLLKQVGINPVVVHGGGPQIGTMLKKLDIESEFIDGLRVTSKDAVSVAEMVLCGGVNKNIVADINAKGGCAIGLSGKDSSLVTAEKIIRKRADGSEVDLGFVGTPKAVDATFIEQSIANGIIPVIAPIAMGEDGQTYNINADTMAGAIAGALNARRFILLTDVSGVMNKAGEILTELSFSDVDTLIKDGTITGGMLPKVETCVNAVKAGVNGAVILDGRVLHAILLEIFTERGAGTLIRE
ncbi:acetylglutamate kinase [Kordiimonas sediminis]